MTVPLYQQVALTRDFLERDLRKGDVAVLVDTVLNPEGGEPGYFLEVSNALGETIAVVEVREADIEGLRADQILTVRPLTNAP